MEYLLFIGAIAFVLTFFLVSGALASKKRRRELDEAFGKIPPIKQLDDSVQNYWNEFSKRNRDVNQIDQTTWADLEMDAVFSRINTCLSSVGEEYLFAALHLPVSKTVLSRREKLAALFKDATLRLKTQIALDKLGKNRFNGQWLLMFVPQTLDIGSHRRYLAQALLPLLGVAALFFNLNLGITIILLTCLANFITFHLVKAKTELALEHISYLTKTLRCAKRLEKLLSAPYPELSKDFTTSLVGFKTLNFSSFMLAVSPQSDADILISFIGMLTLTPVIQYCKSVKLLMDKQEEVQELFSLVGNVDASLSLASFRASLGYFAQPTFGDVLAIQGQDLYHPLLKTPVSNDVLLDKNLLLTGSNASGKSTYVKTIAINLLLAQTLNTCCARSLCLKPAPIITAMEISDNIIDGESYFVAEIKSIKRIVSSAEADTEFYCFIDEILKGTNTAERIAASVAVLDFLHQKNCICVAATHDLQLTQLLGGKYLNKHFTEIIDDSGMLFDYKLKDGPSQSKNAIKLLSHFDYPNVIITNANDLVEKLETERP